MKPRLRDKAQRERRCAQSDGSEGELRARETVVMNAARRVARRRIEAQLTEQGRPEGGAAGTEA